MSRGGRPRAAMPEQVERVRSLAAEQGSERKIAELVFGDARYRGRVERILRPAPPSSTRDPAVEVHSPVKSDEGPPEGRAGAVDSRPRQPPSTTAHKARRPALAEGDRAASQAGAGARGAGDTEAPERAHARSSLAKSMAKL